MLQQIMGPLGNAGGNDLLNNFNSFGASVNSTIRDAANGELNNTLQR